CQQGYATPYSF
nr:immunoglobulin light chain junction region [Macaca mulatta]